MSEVTFPSNTICYVLHVNKPQYAKRKEHITKTMSAHNIPFEWIYDGNQEDIQIQSEEQSSQLDTIPVQVFINLVCRQMELDPSKYYCYTQIGQRKHYLQDDSTLRRAILNQTEIFLEQFGPQQASFSDFVM